MHLTIILLLSFHLCQKNWKLGWDPIVEGIDDDQWYYLNWRTFDSYLKYRGLWACEYGSLGKMVHVSCTWKLSDARHWEDDGEVPLHASDDPSELRWGLICSVQLLTCNNRSDKWSELFISPSVREVTQVFRDNIWLDSLEPEFQRNPYHIISRFWTLKRDKISGRYHIEDTVGQSQKRTMELHVMPHDEPKVKDIATASSTSEKEVEVISNGRTQLRELRCAMKDDVLSEGRGYPAFTVDEVNIFFALRDPPTRCQKRMSCNTQSMHPEDMTGMFVGNFDDDVQFLHVDFDKTPSVDEARAISGDTPPVLRAVKVTGDRTIPKGETSFFGILRYDKTIEQFHRLRTSEWDGEVHPLEGFGRAEVHEETEESTVPWEKIHIFFLSMDLILDMSVNFETAPTSGSLAKLARRFPSKEEITSSSLVGAFLLFLPRK
ncbi:hypothetical protein PROFUN_12475 [Planoprotostelium fungivorum]|uniref:Uncharacterized protein n=1 Tax=Planoprotostelium fungivorum TaxID=1890364 RepID=A0A2P6N7E5_9EUKA|nr:hypothetical protein PROFUN_12475 [Planoprotostelium fungivorum]